MNATTDYKKLTLETAWDKKELFVYLQIGSRSCTRKLTRNSETLSTRNNTEFVIENEDEGIESLLSSSYLDFDLSKYDSVSSISHQQTDDIDKSNKLNFETQTRTCLISISKNISTFLSMTNYQSTNWFYCPV